jgi:hypothetical protein
MQDDRDGRPYRKSYAPQHEACHFSASALCPTLLGRRQLERPPVEPHGAAADARRLRHVQPLSRAFSQHQQPLCISNRSSGSAWRSSCPGTLNTAPGCVYPANRSWTLTICGMLDEIAYSRNTLYRGTLMKIRQVAGFTVDAQRSERLGGHGCQHSCR